jgi:hypothetical protein
MTSSTQQREFTQPLPLFHPPLQTNFHTTATSPFGPPSKPALASSPHQPTPCVPSSAPSSPSPPTPAIHREANSEARTRRTLPAPAPGLRISRSSNHNNSSCNETAQSRSPTRRIRIRIPGRWARAAPSGTRVRIYLVSQLLRRRGGRRRAMAGYRCVGRLRCSGRVGERGGRGRG